MKFRPNWFVRSRDIDVQISTGSKVLNQNLTLKHTKSVIMDSGGHADYKTYLWKNMQFFANFGSPF